MDMNEIQKERNQIQIQQRIDDILNVFPHFQIFLKCLDESHITITSIEMMFQYFNICLFHLCISSDISYEDKLHFFRECIKSLRDYHLKKRIFTESQKEIIHYFSTLLDENDLQQLLLYEDSSSLLEQEIRRVYSFYINTLLMMHKTNEHTIDDLLGMTDCNRKKEKEYWISYIIREMKNLNEDGLLQIISFLHLKKSQKDFDVEINLSHLTLETLRSLVDLIKSCLHHQHLL